MKTNFTFSILRYYSMLFFTLLITPAIQGQWSDDAGENNVVTNADKDQSRNCIVSDGLGNILLDGGILGMPQMLYWEVRSMHRN